MVHQINYGVLVFNNIQQMLVNVSKNMAKCIVEEQCSYTPPNFIADNNNTTTPSYCRNIDDEEDFTREPNPV